MDVNKRVTGKYVVNGTERQIFCQFLFCSQYIVSIYYPYRAFLSFFLVYIQFRFIIVSLGFHAARCHDSVTRALQWCHNGYPGVYLRSLVGQWSGTVLVNRGRLEAFPCFSDTECVYQLSFWYHDRFGIDTSIFLQSDVTFDWVSHHTPRLRLGVGWDCNSKVTPLWPQYRYQRLLYIPINAFGISHWWSVTWSVIGY